VQISHHKHGQAADPATPFAAQGCETCHGAGETHVVNILEESADMGGMIIYAGARASPVAQQNGMCTGCHLGGSFMHWEASAHEGADLACTGCHTVHKPDKVRERATQVEVCYSCHQGIRAETLRASSHPVREGKVICSDCHNPHGGRGSRELKQLTVNENCYTCHAEKRGPFLWEHYPASEDCTLCHNVHGSNHAALLNRQGPQLCQQCHGRISGRGSSHSREFLDFADPDLARGRFILGENCLNCHSQVHGSNHPSGVNLLR
jgi:DmsE family decaheme c-type cytochrome